MLIRNLAFQTTLCMENDNIPVVTIIGGGFCGMMTAVNLFNSPTPVRIIIINSDYPFGKGVAYCAHTEKYLLNVRAINMSAYADIPQHFLDWICGLDKYKNIPKNIMTNVYVPRKIYGEYLSTVWNEALQVKTDCVQIEQMNAKAVDVTIHSNHYTIHLEDKSFLHTNIVVLATGNTKPAELNIANMSFLESKKYFANPWTKECVTHLHSTKDLLIVGNGLTMIDTVLGLLENGFKHTIYTISPNGFSLLPHKYNLLVYEKIVSELPEDCSLHNILTLTKQHAKRLSAVGIGVHLIIDALRPHSQKIWQSWSLKEKKTFIKKLSKPWTALRHRIPLHIFEYIQELRVKKRVVSFKGKLINAIEAEEGVHVSFFNKETKQEETILASRVINCTGPDSNIRRSSNVLLKNLAQKELIVPDALQLGIDSDTTTGRVKNSNGEINKTLFTLGSNLRGVLWESNAVPELRMQAQLVAKNILETAKELVNGVIVEKQTDYVEQ